MGYILRADVLDKGFVELQDVMGTDLAIVNAARTSFLGESKGDDKDQRLLKYLWSHGHHSPFEMCEMKFRIHAPELVWRQLLRHRSGNFNLQSGRYTEYLENEFYVPSTWRKQSSSNKQGSEGQISDVDALNLTRKLRMRYEEAYRDYEQALEIGAAREIARLFLLGFGVYSTGVVKFDLRNLLHFLDLRADSHAQWEIQQYANTIKGMVKEKFPWTYEAWSNE